jgi:hypothetical protein
VKIGFAMILAVALSSVGIATATSGDPSQRHTPAGMALARSVLLTASDLGAGWKSAGSKSGGGRLSCDAAIAPSESDLVETGGAVGPLISRGRYHALAQSVRVFATKAQLDTAWMRTLTQKLVICMEQQLENTSSMMSPVSVTEWSRLPVERVAQHFAGRRVIATATTGKNSSTRVYLDVFLIGGSRTLTTFVLSSLKTPFSDAFERALTESVGRRLAG